MACATVQVKAYSFQARAPEVARHGTNVVAAAVPSPTDVTAVYRASALPLGGQAEAAAVAEAKKAANAKAKNAADVKAKKAADAKAVKEAGAAVAKAKKAAAAKAVKEASAAAAKAKKAAAAKAAKEAAAAAKKAKEKALLKAADAKAAKAVKQAAAKDDGTWRGKCVREFELLPLPAAWAKSAALAKDTQADEGVWQKYHAFRTQHEQARAQHERGQEDDEEDMNCNNLDGAFHQYVQGEFEAEVDRVVAADAAAADIAERWRTGTYMSSEAQWDGGDGVRCLEVTAVSFSPFALPRAMSFRMSYYDNTCYRSDYGMQWTYKLQRFDGYNDWDEDDSAEKTKTKERRNKPQLLCSCGSQPYPELSENGMTGSHNGRRIEQALEDTGLHSRHSPSIDSFDISKLTPAAMRKARSWLLGSTAALSVKMLGDFALLRLVFACCGTAGFKPCLQVSNLPCWHSYQPPPGPEAGEQDLERRSEQYNESGWANGYPDEEDEEDEEGEEGEDALDRPGRPLSWVEHQVRTIAGALRPCDAQYQPSDEQGKRTAWGLAVVETIERFTVKRWETVPRQLVAHTLKYTDGAGGMTKIGQLQWENSHGYVKPMEVAEIKRQIAELRETPGAVWDICTKSAFGRSPTTWALLEQTEYGEDDYADEDTYSDGHHGIGIRWW